jgi:hypothetical protein
LPWPADDDDVELFEDDDDEVGDEVMATVRVTPSSNVVPIGILLGV